MMARLLEAVRPEARLLLVGDPDQLASVEAGAVLADLVEGLGARDDGRIAALRTSHRFGESIGAWPRPSGPATPTRRSRCSGRRRARRLVATPTTRPRLRSLLVAAGPRPASGPPSGGDVEATLAILDRQRLLCAHRRGPVRRTPLEPAGRALAHRGDGGADLVDVVRRSPAAGHRQRLRSRRLQRRHRRRRTPRRRRTACARRRQHAASRPRDQPARRRSRPCTR